MSCASSWYLQFVFCWTRGVSPLPSYRGAGLRRTRASITLVVAAGEGGHRVRGVVLVRRVLVDVPAASRSAHASKFW